MANKAWSKTEDKIVLKLSSVSVPYKKRVDYLVDRSQDAIRQRTWELKQRTGGDWLATQRIGFLDIETSDLKANFGLMLSWALKIKDGPLLHSVIKRREVINKDRLDRGIIKELLKALNEVDVLVTYNGTLFDLPFLRTRCLIHGLGFPGYGEKKHIDVYFQVKSRLSLHRKSLDAACEALNIAGKTPIKPKVWFEAQLGYKDALKNVLHHNDADVIILEHLFERLKPFTLSTRKSL